MINQANEIEWKYLIVKLNQLKRQFVYNAQQLRQDGTLSNENINRNSRKVKTENNPTTVWLSDKL